MQYVESRMSFIAPNLSAIVGSAVAAKLIGKVQCTFLMLHYHEFMEEFVWLN